jgi:hypothetical protein
MSTEYADTKSLLELATYVEMTRMEDELVLPLPTKGLKVTCP